MSLIKGITGIAQYICKNLNFPKAWHSMIYEWTIKPLLKLWKLVIVFNTCILNVLFVNKNTSRSIRSRLGLKNSMIVCRCLTYAPDRFFKHCNIVSHHHDQSCSLAGRIPKMVPVYWHNTMLQPLWCQHCDWWWPGPASGHRRPPWKTQAGQRISGVRQRSVNMLRYIIGHELLSTW